MKPPLEITQMGYAGDTEKYLEFGIELFVICVLLTIEVDVKLL
jgi:hypothetical protein